jgi:hypothetical protein
MQQNFKDQIDFTGLNFIIFLCVIYLFKSPLLNLIKKSKRFRNGCLRSIFDMKKRTFYSIFYVFLLFYLLNLSPANFISNVLVILWFSFLLSSIFDIFYQLLLLFNVLESSDSLANIGHILTIFVRLFIVFWSYNTKSSFLKNLNTPLFLLCFFFIFAISTDIHMAVKNKLLN